MPHMLKTASVITNTTAFVLILGLQPRTAAACSWLGNPIKSSLPANGSEGVPIDVAPIIRGYWEAETLIWETEAGAAVPFDLVSGASASFTEGQTAELVPRELLLPNTTYVIRASFQHAAPANLASQERVVFTTGDAAAETGEL